MFGIRLPILVAAVAVLGGLAAVVFLFGGASDRAPRDVSSAPVRSTANLPGQPASDPRGAGMASAGGRAHRDDAGSAAWGSGDASRVDRGRGSVASAAGGDGRSGGGLDRSAASRGARASTVALVERRESSRTPEAGNARNSGFRTVGGRPDATPGAGSEPTAGDGSSAAAGGFAPVADDAPREPSIYDRAVDGEWRPPDAPPLGSREVARASNEGGGSLAECAAAGTCYDRAVDGEWRPPVE